MSKKAKKVLCDYCKKQAEYVDSSAVYRRSYGMIYLCRTCSAWVGVHRGTDKPLGRLANAELRDWKKKAHATFDPLWQAKLKLRREQRGSDYKKHWARGSAYKWLSEQLGISKKDCHIGMFDVDKCKKVVEICQPFLQNLRMAR